MFLSALKSLIRAAHYRDPDNEMAYMALRTMHYVCENGTYAINLETGSVVGITDASSRVPEAEPFLVIDDPLAPHQETEEHHNALVKWLEGVGMDSILCKLPPGDASR